MKISYAVTTHNEHKEIEQLIPFILEFKDDEDELVIIDDGSDHKTWAVFDKYIHDKSNNINFVERGFNGDFSVHKNFMMSQCSGDWIFNLDADEIPHEILMLNAKNFIKANPIIELFWVPRWNTVEGITEEHAKRWGWNVDGLGRINWPDPQQRLWKNESHIKWQRRVHERLTGPTHDTTLPFEEDYCIYHHKTINKQEEQNAHYERLMR